MNVAELLLNIKNESNGHYQTVLNGLSTEQGIEICKQLEKYVDEEYSFVLELWTNGGFSIYQKDFWKKDEHPCGHTDRLIVSCE